MKRISRRLLVGLAALIGSHMLSPSLAEACNGKMTVENRATGDMRVLWAREISSGKKTKISKLANQRVNNHKSTSSSLPCNQKPARYEVRYQCEYNGKKYTATFPKKGKTKERYFTIDASRCNTEPTRLVSRGSKKWEDSSREPSISDDGQWVAFASKATQLVRGDTNRKTDIFLWNKKTKKVRLISKGRKGRPANGDSGAPQISPDGRYVVYHSRATNLVSGDTNRKTDVFVFDIQTNRTIRASLDSFGKQTKSDSSFPKISGNGRVIFRSTGKELVPGDTNGARDVFMRDLVKNTTTRVSLASGGHQANGSSSEGGISSDGNRVFFRSRATNLIPGKTLEKDHIYLHDLSTKQTIALDTNSKGEQTDMYTLSQDVDLNKDGSLAVFSSKSRNLPGGGGGVYLKNLATGTTELVEPSATNPQITSDGRFVLFFKMPSLYLQLRDLATGETSRLDRRRDGDPWKTTPRGPTLSGNGKFFAFTYTGLDLKKRPKKFRGPMNDVYWSQTKPKRRK